MKDFKKAQSILYVEDDLGIKEAMSSVLQYFCEELYIASDGEEGLELFKTKSPQIIVTDIVLANMNGMEMSQKIRQIDEEVPIILMSAHNDLEYYKQALELKIDGYLIKPINLKVLENKLTTFIKHMDMKKEIELKDAKLLQQEKESAMNKMYTLILNQWKYPLTSINQIASNTKKDMINNKIQRSEIVKNLNDIIEQTLLISNTMEDMKDFFSNTDKTNNVNIDYSLKTTLKYVTSSLQQSKISFQMQNNVDSKEYIRSRPYDLCIVLMNIINFAKDSLLNETIPNRTIEFYTFTTDSKVVFEIGYNAQILEEEFIETVFDDCVINEEIDPVIFNLCTTRMVVQDRLNGELIIKNNEQSHPIFIIKIPLVD